MIAGVLTFFSGAKWWIAAIAATGLGLYGYGYHQGTTNQLQKINIAQAGQMAEAIETLESFQKKTIGIMRDVQQTNEELNRNVQNIKRPSVSNCDLGPDWLRAVTASVREANSAGAAARADAAAN